VLYPAHVTKAALESYQRSLFRHRKANGKPLAWSGQHLHLKEVRAFFGWLAKKDHIPFSPAEQLDLPRQPRTLPRVILSADEVEQVLALPDVSTPLGVRDRAILELFYASGIRRSELCGLRVDDIHADRHSLLITLGKGKKDRYVPLGTRAEAWLARYLHDARPQFVVDADEQTLFLTQQGEPMNPDTLTEYVSRYIASSQIGKSGSCHLFRHTMATLMHENGADLTVIQLILGHQKPETTQIYAKLSLRRVLDVYGTTHPAERPEPDCGESSDESVADKSTD
jgi:integrase/recombinase XerD